MKAIGATPQSLVLLDDTIFDAQCCADAQTLNTGMLLQFMDRADDDGVIDSDEWAYIFRHVRLEHHMNDDQGSLMKWARVHTNKVTQLVAGYRARAQQERVGREAAL
jgi:hypothetical protein